MHSIVPTPSEAMACRNSEERFTVEVSIARSSDRTESIHRDFDTKATQERYNLAEGVCARDGFVHNWGE